MLSTLSDVSAIEDEDKRSDSEYFRFDPDRLSGSNHMITSWKTNDNYPKKYTVRTTTRRRKETNETSTYTGIEAAIKS